MTTVDKEALLARYAATKFDVKSLASSTDSTYFKIEAGENIARILPAADGAQPIIKVEKHFVNDEHGRRFGFNCPRMSKQPCPLCDYAWAARDRGDQDAFLSYKSKTQYAMYVIDRNSPNPRPLVLALGHKTFSEKLQPLLEQFSSDDALPWDIYGGCDMVLTRKADGDFGTTAITLMRGSSPLSADQDQLVEILSTVPDINDLRETPKDVGALVDRVAGVRYDAVKQLCEPDIVDVQFSDSAAFALTDGDEVPF